MYIGLASSSCSIYATMPQQRRAAREVPFMDFLCENACTKTVG
ncbi:MAG: hypothetical protein VB135_02635 [Burkholderia sp.]